MNTIKIFLLLFLSVLNAQIFIAQTNLGGIARCSGIANNLSELAPSNLTWIQCADYCKSLVTSSSSNWRIPTVNEYLKIRLEQETNLVFSFNYIWTSDFRTDNQYYIIDESSLFVSPDPCYFPMGCRCVSE